MALYTVHAPRPAAGAADPLAFVFVKDGFCWPALFVPVPWLIVRRLWLTLLFYLVAVVALAALGVLAGGQAATALLLVFAFWFGLEANGLRRWTLERRGARLIGVVEARKREEAERRFFAEWQDADASGPSAAGGPPSPPPPPPSAPSGPSSGPSAPGSRPGIVGLFPAPGAGR